MVIFSSPEERPFEYFVWSQLLREHGTYIQLLLPSLCFIIAPPPNMTHLLAACITSLPSTGNEASHGLCLCLSVHYGVSGWRRCSKTAAGSVNERTHRLPKVAHQSMARPDQTKVVRLSEESAFFINLSPPLFLQDANCQLTCGPWKPTVHSPACLAICCACVTTFWAGRCEQKRQLPGKT